MPRYARFTRPDKQTVYHVISRTALPGLPINDIEKDHLLTIIRYFASSNEYRDRQDLTFSQPPVISFLN